MKVIIIALQLHLSQGNDETRWSQDWTQAEWEEVESLAGELR